MADKYRLMIIRSGEIRYAMTEVGDFCPAGKGQPCDPHRFRSRKEAMAAYDHWAQQNPADASDWLPRIVEAVDT